MAGVRVVDVLVVSVVLLGGASAVAARGWMADVQELLSGSRTERYVKCKEKCGVGGDPTRVH